MKNKLVEALVISSGCMVGGGIVYGIAFYLEAQPAIVVVARGGIRILDNRYLFDNQEIT